jgi:hypothetical protein
MGAIRNKNGIWINTEPFREAGNKFITTGRYTDALPGTLEFDRFWDQEYDRCINGYEVSGAKITGKHYFYLNYCLISKVNLNDDNRGKRKVSKGFLLPDFWDGDFEYFWFLEIAENGIDPALIPTLHLNNKVLWTEGGKSMIVGKARRRGFSYKNAATIAWEYTFIKKSLTLVAAYDKKYLFSEIGIFTKVMDMLNHLNEHCPAFKRTRLVNKIADGRIKSGYIEYTEDGTELSKGYQSAITCVSFQNNPDAARGADASKIIVEEAGTFINWNESYYAMEPSIKAGDYYTGMMVVFGTGGDMEAGTVDFAEMYYNPDNYNMMPFENVWDEDALEGKNAGFFFPMYQNYEGAYDKEGNSDVTKAKELLTKLREHKKANAKSPEDYLRHTTEYAWSPSEAFQIISNNVFPTEDLRRQLGFCMTKDEYKGICGRMAYDVNGNPEFVPDLFLKPLEYRDKSLDKSGCIQIWEHPTPGKTYNLYTGGLDPYATDEANYSESLGSLFIFKRYAIGEETHDLPVAEYTGRPQNFKEFYDQCILLIEYYNASCLYENNINNFKTHCENKHKLHLLSRTPSIVKSASNQNTNTYGLRVVGNTYSSVKNELITYVNNWLREEYEEGKSNVYKIKSVGLLQELITYNNRGNFDRFISFSLSLIRNIELSRIQPAFQDPYKRNGRDFFSSKLFSNYN